MLGDCQRLWPDYEREFNDAVSCSIFLGSGCACADLCARAEYVCIRMCQFMFVWACVTVYILKLENAFVYVCVYTHIYSHVLPCYLFIRLLSSYSSSPPPPSPSFVLFCYLRSSKWLSCCCLYLARVSVTAIRLLVVLVLCRWTNGSWCCYCFHVAGISRDLEQLGFNMRVVDTFLLLFSSKHFVRLLGLCYR